MENGSYLYVSVVIPVFNDLERLRICLDALERQTYPRKSYEVIVVDNGSDEDVEAGIKDFKHDFDIEINLYRLIQEGLVNIKKHADARNVTVKLVAAFPNIILRIEDNGIGFDMQKRMATLTKEKRMGIRSMEQRAKLLQGEMEIQSRPMEGTKISIKFPYMEKKIGS